MSNPFLVDAPDLISTSSGTVGNPQQGGGWKYSPAQMQQLDANRAAILQGEKVQDPRTYGSPDDAAPQASGAAAPNPFLVDKTPSTNPFLVDATNQDAVQAPADMAGDIQAGNTLGSGILGAAKGMAQGMASMIPGQTPLGIVGGNPEMATDLPIPASPMAQAQQGAQVAGQFGQAVDQSLPSSITSDPGYQAGQAAMQGIGNVMALPGKGLAAAGLPQVGAAVNTVLPMVAGMLPVGKGLGMLGDVGNKVLGEYGKGPLVASEEATAAATAKGATPVQGELFSYSRESTEAPTPLGLIKTDAKPKNAYGGNSRHPEEDTMAATVPKQEPMSPQEIEQASNRTQGELDLSVATNGEKLGTLVPEKPVEAPVVPPEATEPVAVGAVAAKDINEVAKAVVDENPDAAPTSTPQAIEAEKAQGVLKNLTNINEATQFSERPSDYAPNDLVKLMDGTVGRIMDVSQDDKGNPVYQVRRDNGDVVALPRQQLDYRYKPSGINKVGAAGKPLGKGMGKAQRGAIDFSAGFEKQKAEVSKPEIDVNEVPKEPDSNPLSTQEQVERIQTLYYHSKNLNDFFTRLQIESQRNLGFPSSIAKEAATWWEHFENGERVPEYTFNTLNEATQKLGDASMPYEYANKLWADAVKKRDDLSYGSNELEPGPFQTYNGYDKAGTKVAKWIMDSSRDLRAQATMLAKNLMSHKDLYNALDRDEQLSALSFMNEFDSGGKLHNRLEPNDVMYPTIEMLKDSGASDRVAAAIAKMGEAYEKMFKLSGITKEQLRGYFPHMWDGTYSVMFKHDATGFPTMKKFGTSFMRDRFIEQLKNSADPYTVTEIHDPEVGFNSDYVKALQEAITLFKGGSRLDKPTVANLEFALNKMMKGALLENMERHGVGGYYGDSRPGVNGAKSMGLRPEDSVWQGLMNRNFNNKIANVFDRYVHDVTRNWKNESILRVISDHVFQDPVLSELPQTLKAAEDILAKATGLSKREMLPPQRALEILFSKMGLPPGIPNRVVSALNGTVRVMYINSLRPFFAAKHLIFRSWGVPALLKDHADLALAGVKQGDLGTALGKFITNQVPGTTRLVYDKTAQQALDQFEREGLQSNIYDQTAATAGVTAVGWLKHGLLNTMVNDSRRSTFSLGFEYYRDIMPYSQAVAASRALANRVMQTFDPLERPNIFNEGIIGKLYLPFQQIKAYMLSRYGGAYESLTGKKAEGSTAGLVTRLTPIVSLLLTNFAMGGVNGVIMSNTYDAIIRGINTAFKSDFPTVNEFMQKHNFPSWMQLGLISHWLGVDVSSTFASIEALGYFQSAGAGFAKNMVATGVDAARYLAGEPIDPDKAIQHIAGSTFPQVGAVLKHLEAQKLAGVLQTAGGKPLYKETPADFWTAAVLGARTEHKAMLENRILGSSEEAQRDAARKEDQEKIITDHVIGLDTGKQGLGELVKWSYESGSGLDLANLNKMITSKYKTRVQSSVDNLLEQIEAASAAKDYMKAMELWKVYKDNYHSPDQMK